ncbi:MAG: winged helix-turn-helix domain-containing protein [Candidatus Thermoplasmatota archaeon]
MTKLVADEDIERILLAANGREMTAHEMSEALGIPIARCYRKVRALEDIGLLKEARSLMGRDGRIHKFYMADIDSVYVYYEDGRLRVRLRLILEMAKDFRERYERFVHTAHHRTDNQQ